MAIGPSSANPHLGRGRGGGIRLTSYSPQFDFSYLAHQTISQSSNAFKKFFDHRRKSIGSRQKSFKSLLHTSSYVSHIHKKTSSQSLFPIREEPSKFPANMPSPTNPAPPLDSTSDKTAPWTPVTNGAKRTDSSPSSQPVATTNSFEALSDDDHDDPTDSTEFGSTDVDTDMEGDDKHKRKPKSSRKKKKSAKKSRRPQRKKQYVSFVDSDSDDDIPPRSANQEKLSSSQKNLFGSKTSVTDTPSTSQDDDLVDSDKESTSLKNADIRNFMTSHTETPASTKTTSENESNTIPQPSPDNHTPVPPCRKILDRTSILTPSTPAEKINDFSRYEMISMLTHWNSNIAKNDPSYMLNESSASLRNHIFTLQDSMDDISHEIRINATHQEVTQSRELKHRLNSTPSQSSPVNDNTSDPVLHYDTSNNGGLSSVPESSDAETLGMNVNMMMARPISNNPLRPPSEDTGTKASSVPLTQFTARFEISTKNTTVINVPLIARQLFRIFKKADRTLRLLPWFPDEQNDIASIDQEGDIPPQESQIKQWIDNPRIVKSKLFFAMRVECIVHLKHIRDTFIPWMAKNDSQIKLDTLTAREIYGLGFIADVHPRLYNRALLKEFLHQQLRAKNHDLELNVYSRRVWSSKNNQRLSCQGIVLEVDKKYRDAATSALMDIQFPPYYRYAKYVPFDKTIVPDELLYDILLSNNQYQANTRRKVITGLSDCSQSHSTLEGSPSTIRDWLMSIKNPRTNEYIFEHVEVSRDDLAVIYSTDYEETVRDFLNHITEHIRGTFSHPNDILSTTKNLNTYMSSKTTASQAYAKKLASIFASNPQDPPPPPPKVSPKPKTIYYGAADSVQTTYLNHLTQPKQPPPKTGSPPHSTSKNTASKPVTPPPSQHESESIISRLDRLEQVQQNHMSQVDAKLDRHFKEMEKKQDENQEKVIATVTTVVTTTLPQLITEQLKVAFQQQEGEKL